MRIHRSSLATAFALLVLTAPMTALPAASGSQADVWDLLSSPVVAALRGVPGGGEVPSAESADEAQVTRSTAAQNEPGVAVNPLNPMNVIAGWNDYDTRASGAGVWTGIGTSKDGGATWNDRILGPSPRDVPGAVRARLTTLDVPFTYAGDPIVAFNGLGTAVAGGLIFDGFDRSAIYVQTSLDGGDSFTPQLLIAWDDHNVPAGFTDKPWMRADTTGNGVYVCWSHFLQSGGITIYATASQDGLGLVWTNPVPVSTEGFVQGCDIGVGPDGEVYITYHHMTGWGNAGGGYAKMVKSTDKGVTWSAPSTIGSIAPLNLPNAAFRYNHFPRIAVDPTDGAVYVAWAEGSGDVVLTKSTDGGASWSAKRLVNNDGTGRAQFFPAIDVGPDGKVVVGFYDRREDPANRVAKYYLAESTDGGLTFPVQHAAGASTIDGLNTRHWFMGDYTDLRVGSDGKAHAVWAAAPGTNQDIYTN